MTQPKKTIKTMETEKKELSKVEVKQFDIFQLMKKDGKVAICVGNNKVSTLEFQTFKDAETYLRKKPYEIMVNIAGLMAHIIMNNQKK